MITVPIYLVVGQAALLALACFVLASAYRRLGKPAEHTHGQEDDDAARLVGTALPDLGEVVAADGSRTAPPRAPGPGTPALLIYVLPGCETCQAALEHLQPMLERLGTARPDVHVLSVGAHSSVDAYRRFDLPIWQAERNLSDIFGLKAYPVFLAVDARGMIKASGSAHDPDALREYLAIGPDAPPTPRSPQGVTITSKP